MGKDGEGAVEEPMLEIIKATVKNPEGYALGESSLLVLFSIRIAELYHAMDPSSHCRLDQNYYYAEFPHLIGKPFDVTIASRLTSNTAGAHPIRIVVCY